MRLFWTGETQIVRYRVAQHVLVVHCSNILFITILIHLETLVTHTRIMMLTRESKQMYHIVQSLLLHRSSHFCFVSLYCSVSFRFYSGSFSSKISSMCVMHTLFGFVFWIKYGVGATLRERKHLPYNDAGRGTHILRHK